MSNPNVTNKPKTSTKSYESSGVQSSTAEETFLQRHFRINISNLLAILGILLGITLGFSLRYSFTHHTEYWNPRRLSYVRFPGEIFIMMIDGIKVPLLLSCMAAAIGSMDFKTFGFALWRVFAYNTLITLIGAFFAALVVIILHPGDPKDHPKHSVCYITFGDLPNLQFGQASCSKDLHPCYLIDYERDVWEFIPGTLGTDVTLNPYDCGDKFRIEACDIPVDNFLNLLESFFPDNLLNAFVYQTERHPDFAAPNDPSQSSPTTCVSYSIQKEPKPSLEDFGVVFDNERGTNVSGLLGVTIVLALGAVCLGDYSAVPILNLFTSLSQCMLKMAVWIIWLCPIGICSLITSNILTKTDILTMKKSNYFYMLTTIIVLLLFGFGVLPGIYYLFVRKSPIRFYKRILPLIGVGFGTAASQTTIPLMIQILEQSCRLDPRIVRFMVPIATELNLAGSAIYLIISILYVAQLHGIQLDLCTVITAIFIAMSSLIIKTRGKGSETYAERRLRIIFSAIQMPSPFYVYVTGVYWILDHVISVTNILTNCVGVAIVDHLCSRQFEIMRLEEESRIAAAAKKFDFEEPPDILTKEDYPRNNISNMVDQQKQKHEDEHSKASKISSPSQPRHAVIAPIISTFYSSNPRTITTSVISHSRSKPKVKHNANKNNSLQSQHRPLAIKDKKHEAQPSKRVVSAGSRDSSIKSKTTQTSLTKKVTKGISATSLQSNKYRKSWRSSIKSSRSKGN